MFRGGKSAMRIAITQPTYLPWLGYFDLIDQVDTFVILDTVQFEKQSWQQRNRIKTPTGLMWLTVPVAFRGRLGQKIQEVEIRDDEFWRKHLRGIEVYYGRAPYFGAYFPQVSSILQDCRPGTLLVDLNLRLLDWFLQMFGIRTPVVRASSLAQEGKRSELLANICQKLGASQYVSPLGSADYLLDEMSYFKDSGVEVSFQNYRHPEYRQLFPPFVSHACALDLVFNEGERSAEIIRSGRGKGFSQEDVALRLGKVMGS
jgi:WbqC-like protein family